MLPQPLRRVASVAAVLVATALPRSIDVQPTGAPPAPIDVLFVGNSYTYFNNLPALVEGISKAVDGPAIRADMRTGPGYRLSQFIADEDLEALLEGNPRSGEAWDEVVLQEQSQLATDMADPKAGKLGDPGAFHTSVRALASKIEEHGAKSRLYMTWAKERFPAQLDDLARAYESIGAELEVPVAPVGRAWARVLRERPTTRLFLADGSHPNPAGSYLTACVLYASLTGQSPAGAPAEINGQPWSVAGPVASESPTVLVSLDPELTEYLQRVAWDVVRSSEPR